jgi:hypothetical protein
LHFFHGEELLLFDLLDLPDLAKATPTNYIEEFERVLGYGWSQFKILPVTLSLSYSGLKLQPPIIINI